MIVYQAHNHLRDTLYVGKTIKSLDSRRRQHFAYAEPGVYGWTQL